MLKHLLILVDEMNLKLAEKAEFQECLYLPQAISTFKQKWLDTA